MINEAIDLLRQLIHTPSLSGDEEGTATLIGRFLSSKNIAFERRGHNIWAKNRHYTPGKPVLLLNSHHDTVKPNKGYTRDPFAADTEDGKLYGLGSNDAGGALVCLLTAFVRFYERADLPFNLVVAATAEEENSGPNGLTSVLPLLGPVDCAIVGEPTLLQAAVAEKGLLVLDCTAHGRAGHAARAEGDNAIYHALKDIEWFRTYSFPKVSEFLGPVKMSVTVIQAGHLHNMVPDECRFTVDVRVNECYTHEQVLDAVRGHVGCTVTPRSMRLRSSMIAPEHPLVRAAVSLGSRPYGSPTCSDKALMPFPALKIGPGDSARSHTADEFIYLDEIAAGIETYTALIEQYTP